MQQRGAATQAKVVLLGEGRVGKTSLVLRFCKEVFSEGQPPTVQASYLDKQLTIGDKRINLAIWDTAGQARPRPAPPPLHPARSARAAPPPLAPAQRVTGEAVLGAGAVPRARSDLLPRRRCGAPRLRHHRRRVLH